MCVVTQDRAKEMQTLYLGLKQTESWRAKVAAQEKEKDEKEEGDDEDDEEDDYRYWVSVIYIHISYCSNVFVFIKLF